MKHLLLLIATLLVSNLAQAKTLVVSDIDDTIRQSDVLNLLNASLKLVGTPSEFKGLGTVFRDLVAQQEADGEELAIAYVSASIPLFYDADAWVRKKGLPTGYVRQRASLNEDKRRFKIESIRKFLAERYLPGDEVLFFGDNAELDPQIYLSLQRELGLEGSSSIFIRDVRLDSTPYAYGLTPRPTPGVTYFLTPLDLLSHPALRRLSAGARARLSALRRQGKLVPDYLVERIANRIERCPQGKPLIVVKCQRGARAKARAWLDARIPQL